MNTFVPNFDLHSALDFDTDSDGEENVKQLKHGAGNIYNNCTFNINPIFTNKFENKRRRIMIDSDGDSD